MIGVDAVLYNIGARLMRPLAFGVVGAFRL